MPGRPGPAIFGGRCPGPGPGRCPARDGGGRERRRHAHRRQSRGAACCPSRSARLASNRAQVAWPLRRLDAPLQLVRLWDVETGQEPRGFRGHEDLVNSVAFTPGGRLAVSGSSDATVRVWDVGSGNPVVGLRDTRTVYRAVAFLPGGRHVVSGSRLFRKLRNRSAESRDLCSDFLNFRKSLVRINLSGSGTSTRNGCCTTSAVTRGTSAAWRSATMASGSCPAAPAVPWDRRRYGCGNYRRERGRANRHPYRGAESMASSLTP
jgi:hypothetical protein